MASARERLAGLGGDALLAAFAVRPGTLVKGSEAADLDMPMRPATTSDRRGLGGDGPKPADEFGLAPSCPARPPPSVTNSRSRVLWPSGVSKLVEPGGPRAPSPERPPNGMPPGAADLDEELKPLTVLRPRRSNASEEPGEKPSDACIDSDAFVEAIEVLNLLVFFLNNGELSARAGAFVANSRWLFSTILAGWVTADCPHELITSITEGPHFTSAAISDPAAISD